MQKLRFINNFFLGISLVILATLPLFIAFGDSYPEANKLFYELSLISVFLVMIIRPLADIFASQKWLRKLILLRKGIGVFSASFVVAILIGKIITPYSGYFASIFTVEYWSIVDYKLFARVADVSAILLLITSNTFSMMLLKKNWKKVQKLAYVYFYSGAIYQTLVSQDVFAMVAIVIVTIVTCVAFFIHRKKKNSQPLQ